MSYQVFTRKLSNFFLSVPFEYRSIVTLSEWPSDSAQLNGYSHTGVRPYAITTDFHQLTFFKAFYDKSFQII